MDVRFIRIGDSRGGDICSRVFLRHGGGMLRIEFPDIILAYTSILACGLITTALVFGETTLTIIFAWIGIAILGWVAVMCWTATVCAVVGLHYDSKEADDQQGNRT